MHGLCCLGWMDGWKKEPLFDDAVVKVSRRVSITSAFGQGTAGKVSRAELAAPLTPAYGHCAVARLDSDRWPRQSLFQRPPDQGNYADLIHRLQRSQSPPSK
ncbi:hypothetical protein T4D_5954 [Trichinella pseudospiralis]|uniref:Uncharacterized protein n=1 Tax=Trichinella pseudospiralis TaxID=6337 RepID=A0A0V1FVL6_TRIPS|nr:hypothetical protein T4D_5954 [Trichinella pseudospiralis]